MGHDRVRALSRRYGINQNTVARWKKRTSRADRPTGPKEPHSTVLSLEEEAVTVVFRRHTLLPLDDCLMRAKRSTIRGCSILLRKQYAWTSLTASLCTGAAILAKAGLLEGRKETTNKLAFNWSTRQSTKTSWVGHAR